MVFKPA
jgi:hypothetical protein